MRRTARKGRWGVGWGDSTAEQQREQREQAREREQWNRVWRLAYDAHLFRCTTCGYESTGAADIALEMAVVDPGPRRRYRHKCEKCGAMLPWCDERDYLHRGYRP